MDLSIIIVNWNSSGYLDKCIQSIVDNTHGISYEIIVVENASYDDCEKVVEKYRDVTTLIQSTENLGFARANNLGYRYSRGSSLLFLNPDTQILGDALSRLHKTVLFLADVGGLGCRILNTDGSIQTSCIQAFPTILNQMLDAEWFQNRFPKSRLWGMGPLFEISDRAIEVEAIAGSCLMVRRDCFEKIGLFSEEYFMYSEDLDLCYKMRLHGYRNYHFGAASVIHHGGGSTKFTVNSSFSAVLMRESLKMFLRKFHGSIYSFSYVLAMQLMSMVRIVILLFMYPISFLNLKRKREIDTSLNKWRSIFLWSIGMKDCRG